VSFSLTSCFIPCPRRKPVKAAAVVTSTSGSSGSSSGSGAGAGSVVGAGAAGSGQCPEAMPNTELWGDVVVWGATNKVASADECCRQCTTHK
jgi:hypothetical protein